MIINHDREPECGESEGAEFNLQRMGAPQNSFDAEFSDGQPQLNYGTFQLTKAVVPISSISFVPREGFRHEPSTYQIGSEQQVPGILVSVSAEKIFDVFSSLLRIGNPIDEVEVVVQTLSPVSRACHDIATGTIENVILQSKLGEFESLITNAANVRFTALCKSEMRDPFQVSIDEFKLILIASEDQMFLARASAILDLEHGIYHDHSIKFISEVRHEIGIGEESQGARLEALISELQLRS